MSSIRKKLLAGKLFNTNIPALPGSNGENHKRCVSCYMLFHVNKNGLTMCNGNVIHLCPFCRADSRPWKYGRGT